MKKNFFSLVLVTALAVSALSACTQTPAPDSAPEPELVNEGPAPTPEPATARPKGTIILSTTTSTQDSGLLDFILPAFTEETGWEVDVIAVGTGAALQMGRDGEADVLLVHAKADELTFVEEGYGVERFDVMYNDFVIVGVADGIEHNHDVLATFTEIAESDLPFVSRGDDSGTHKKELSIWNELGVDVTALSSYISAGQGMGATLQMAGETAGYTLSDRATWLTTSGLDLEIVCEGSDQLLNLYGVIAVNPETNDKINQEGGQAFVDWILSDSAQALISEFGVAEFGSPLFTPNAQ